MKEIEAKFKVGNLSLIAEKLKGLNFKLAWQGLDENWYFDSVDGKLEARGQVLRLRRWDTHKATLTLKGNRTKRADNIKELDELEIGLDSLEKARQILLALGLVEVMSYNKQRQHWKNDWAVVELDTLNGQHYVEIEASQAKLDQLVQKLGFSLENAIKESYLDIIKASKK